MPKRTRHSFRGKEQAVRKKYYGHPLYHCYYSMIQRCYNEKNNNYYKYGARGITVCRRWRESFAAFIEDMAPDWQSGLSIDRIDNNGEYSPINCHWTDIAHQQRNRRSCIYIEFEGKRRTMAEWSRKIFNNEHLVKKRIRVCGWDPIRALTTPKI